MPLISLVAFRKQVGEYLNRTHYGKEDFVISKSGKPIAALVPMDLWERLKESGFVKSYFGNEEAPSDDRSPADST